MYIPCMINRIWDLKQHGLAFDVYPTWVRIPLQTYFHIDFFFAPVIFLTVRGAPVNEIKHDHLPRVYVVVDLRYDKSYMAYAYILKQKSLRNSEPCWHFIYNKKFSTKNGLKTDCSSLSTC